jgi:uncharacterized metal-binding protein YceD (DUF177 family)
MTQPEFSRTFPVDQIGSQAREINITAEPDERTALARRFTLEAMHRLDASARLESNDGAILCQGQFSADVVQNCVATGAPIAISISNQFAIRFVPETEGDEAAGEIDIRVDDFDVVEHDGRSIDVGEAVAQSLLLALDPFPRSDKAEETLRAAGVISDDEVFSGAFAGLKSLLQPK